LNWAILVENDSHRWFFWCGVENLFFRTFAIRPEVFDGILAVLQRTYWYGNQNLEQEEKSSTA
jgi:hypothetical protein